ncbi:MAG: phosphoglucosamine mutase [Cenarchaeum symbiont of Oopsacas minuta]|nr:phosphoglucosamine mutase [Cenarchaeum symbiont of Oopsacas minuta]
MKLSKPTTSPIVYTMDTHKFRVYIAIRMTRLFGTNGIRGVFGKDMSLEFVHDISLSLAIHFGKGPVLVGYDGRNSGPAMTKMVCSALNFAGLDCNLAGLVPTPCLEFAVKKLGYAWGIMITASHNPPEYNGIKPISSNGTEISRQDELDVESVYYDRIKPLKSAKWGETNKEKRTVDAYIKGITSLVNSAHIKKQNLSIVLDMGNGAQIVTAKILCENLDCKTFTINGDIDGSFSGRGSEPTPENLQELSIAVKKHHADLGVAFDGDGDRSMFCDELGNILTGDQSALLFTEYILEKNPGSTVVTCLNSSNAIEELASRTKSPIIRTNVGSVEVTQRMLQENALVGFEENGGYMYGPHNPVRDGAMMTALALEMIATSGRTISQRIQSLPESFTGKRKVACDSNNAKSLLDALSKEYPDADTTDGIKMSFGDEKWVMVRPSGTEPIVRVYAEATSEEELVDLLSKYVNKIRSTLSDNTFNTNTEQFEDGNNIHR